MDKDLKLFEDENTELTSDQDPDETPVANRKLVTQPYDLVIESVVEQIRNNTLHLRPLSARPRFQRRFVWPPRLSSRLIESILLNVPIPPCYLSQNEQFELDAIDGQQRLMSIYRYLDNQFALSNLEVLKEFNSLRFHQLPERERNRLRTYTMRCVVITNDSHPEIKFDVFERLNTNTIPLNQQELRNCIYRGPLNNLLEELAEYKPWLSILGRRDPDSRLRDEEVILRFFAFHLKGVDSYRTPQKHWLNEVAKEGRAFPEAKINELRNVWKSTVDKCLIIFPPRECFRRLPVGPRPTVANRALMDLTMSTVTNMSIQQVQAVKEEFYDRYKEVLMDGEFDDLISKSVDHKKRTLRRHEIWSEKLESGLL